MSEWFSTLEVPEPPEDLRRSTLAAATDRWSRPVEADRWRRIWESRPLRLAWAGTVVVLAAAHLAVPTRTVPPRASSAVSDELREIVKLPRLRAGYVAAAPEPTVTPKKEKRT